MRPSKNFRRSYHAGSLFACLAALMVAQPAEARTWKGGLSYRGAPAAGATVTICGESAETNNSGRFRVSVPDDTQSCRIVVRFQNRESKPLHTDARPYLNLSLKRSADGWLLVLQ